MNELIRQDGFINATLLCKKGGKRFAKWNENKSTKIFLSKLQEHLSTPIDELVIIKQGGNNQTQGTWIHPIIATNLAQWISPEFSIKTSQWIEEWKQYKNRPPGCYRRTHNNR